MNTQTAASAEGESSPSRRVTQPLYRPRGRARTVFPGWLSEGAVRSSEPTREIPVRIRSAADPDRPRLFFAGVPPGHGPMDVLVRHLEGLGVWEIMQTDSTHGVLEKWEELQPDVIVTVWSSESELQAWVTEIRSRREGRHLPIVVAGGPPGPGGGPFQPVRGVLCLPSPLKWRTFLLCLEEHWRTLRRNPA